jgi:hypothetical protein
MIDIANRRCSYLGCTTHPNFGLPSDVKATRCKEHAESGMVDIVHERCSYSGCTTRPSFGLPSDVKATRCKEHVESGMVDIVSKRCSYLGCATHPNFGLPSDVKATRCKEHADPDMIDIKNKRCSHPGCTARPSFGLPSDVKATRCKEHAESGMIDIVNKRCSYPYCITFAYYGYLFQSPTHCAAHKLPNQYNRSRINPKCHSPGCTNRPYYSTNSRPNSCERHKLPEEINIIERPCKSCKLSYFIPADRDLCDYCYNPGFATPITTRKIKESRIKQLLDSNNIIYDSYDKIIDASCSRYRPDFVIDNPLFKIILEVDENQHRVYDKTCEHKRMVQLINDLGSEQALFIRYNPDEFRISGKKQKIPAHDREVALINLLKQYMSRIDPLPNPGISIIYLYYDDSTPEIVHADDYPSEI